MADLEARRRTLRDTGWGRLVLRTTAGFWRLGAVARGQAFDRGFLPIRDAGLPVISVGNLLAGGTGKTPIAQDLCLRLARAGARVALVSRGYGGSHRQTQIVSTGIEQCASVEQAGDEAVASAQALMGRAAVVCGADRGAAARAARERLGVQIVVLDDAFQHRRLARDLDLVIMPEAFPPHDLAPLPWGRLRESWSAGERADLRLFVEPAGADPPPSGSHPWSRGRGFQQTRDLAFALEPEELRTLPGNQRIPLDALSDRRIACLSAIARPERFHDDLQTLGAELVLRQAEGDHEPFVATRVVELLDRAAECGATALVTTHKDAVKLSAMPRLRNTDLPIWVLLRRVRWSADSESRLTRALRLILDRLDQSL